MMKETGYTHTKERSEKERPGVRPGKGELVPQPHGGAIRYGNRPGQTPGGIGRPPSELRARLRGSFEDRAHVLEEIASDPNASASDRMKALDLMLRYGLGTHTEHEVRAESLQLSGDVSEALRRALRDPGVRGWLQEQPKMLAELRAELVEAGEQQPEDADFELLSSVPPSGSPDDE
jgi:hypothetical protein